MAGRYACRVDRLSLFGLFAVTATLVCYALEARSPWWILGFAAGCALGSVYGFAQGAWPFGIVEVAWCLVALRRWRMVARSSQPASAGGPGHAAKEPHA